MRSSALCLCLVRYLGWSTRHFTVFVTASCWQCLEWFLRKLEQEIWQVREKASVLLGSRCLLAAARLPGGCVETQWHLYKIRLFQNLHYWIWGARGALIWAVIPGRNLEAVKNPENRFWLSFRRGCMLAASKVAGWWISWRGSSVLFARCHLCRELIARSKILVGSESQKMSQPPCFMIYFLLSL